MQFRFADRQTPILDNPTPDKQVFDRHFGVIMQRLEELLTKSEVRNA